MFLVKAQEIEGFGGRVFLLQGLHIHGTSRIDATNAKVPAGTGHSAHFKCAEYGYAGIARKRALPQSQN